TQARFGYYMTVPVAALNAALIGGLMNYVGGVDESLDVETYQVLTVVAILLVVVAPMLVFSNPVAAGGGAQNPGGVIGWDDSLRWMSENTPDEGQYANPDGENMSYYGTFGRTDDFDYDEGAYGVMSWWDYGHWITGQGERIPVANPFQQGSAEAAEYLLSQSESESFEVLESIDEDDAKTKYVMVDWKMAETESRPPVRGKFFAPPTFDDDSNRSTYYTRILDTESLQQSGIFGSTQAIRHKQAYYDTTLARLYHYHGSAQDTQPVVLDWEGAERSFQGSSTTFVGAPSQGNALKTFPNMTAAREFVEDDGTAQIGGIGPYPSERVPALEHYRLVHMSELTGFQGQLSAAFRRTVGSSGLLDQLRRDLGANASQNQLSQQAIQFLYPNTPSWTKTFERVEGATIEGTGPENTTLRLRAQMNPQNGASFVYRQQVTTDANGDFSTTVPYSTTGYDEIGPEQGYTNTSVRATSPYSITAGISVNESGSLTRWQTTVNVTEAQVVGADDSVVTADLEQEVVGQTEGADGTSGSESDGATDTGEGATNETETGTSTNTTGTDSETNTTGTDSGTNGTQSLTGPRTAGPDLEATRP
ncbi:MAG: oligosaccharyl transferase (archaeosortase A-associated), partial [Haloarculaceae archaeon]